MNQHDMSQHTDGRDIWHIVGLPLPDTLLQTFGEM